ncbi:hypothetical protein D9756_006207 [Leucocoprinus leucothites]|uniref:Gfd2/YDR514C-like C-terminal domain-containing protein n=1 Tax=Leucocoprinus leucothites TaxID=201217 RepID=A0A8H5D4Z7_9AGAR|nr:hypothetical protein D9756_006207 [Leucoagaricus leucothites]
MTDFMLADPKGWEYDLHSVYSAYIGYFQAHNIPWFERTWGHLFTSFEDFLAFSWPTITVTDAYTGRAHIVTRLNSIGAFLKMIKTRFGETLPQAPNILQVTPFETSPRHLRNISDYATYKRLYSTLPAAVLAAQRTRVRAGDSKTIKELWAKRDKTFLALSFVWSERNEKSCLEFGYAAVRCGHMEAVYLFSATAAELSYLGFTGPDIGLPFLIRIIGGLRVDLTSRSTLANVDVHRKGHYIVEEYVDKVINKYPPNQPWQFGESQLTPKAKLPQIVQAVIRPKQQCLYGAMVLAGREWATMNHSLTSPESETSSNSIVLVGFGIHAQLARLEEMKIKLPHNVLTIDIANFERSLYATGARGVIPDPKTERPRTPSTTLNLENLLRTFHQHLQPHRRPGSAKNSSSSGSNRSPPSPLNPNFPQISVPISIPQCSMANSGNDAFMTLFALQMLLDPAGTRVPTIKKGRLGSQAQGQALAMANMNTMQAMNMMGPMGMGMGMPVMPMQGMPPMAYGMPMVAINGGMGPMLVPPGSPRLAPTLNNKNSGLRMRADSGSGKLQHSSSAYDLTGEFGQMKVSMKRAQSSGPTMASANGSSLPTLGRQQQLEKGTRGANGIGSESWRKRKSSFVELGKRE